MSSVPTTAAAIGFRAIIELPSKSLKSCQYAISYPSMASASPNAKSSGRCGRSKLRAEAGRGTAAESGPPCNRWGDIALRGLNGSYELRRGCDVGVLDRVVELAELADEPRERGRSS